LPNVWGLVTTENQATADERIPWLLKTSFAIRGVSCEPLLGGIDLEHYLGIWTNDIVDPHQRLVLDEPMTPNLFTALARPGWARLYRKQLDWVICGGESGPGARPMRPNWARSLRDQWQAAGTPYFFKQWGKWAWPGHAWSVWDWAHPSARGINDKGPPTPIGKKAAGHLLDGHAWQQIPSSITEAKESVK